MVKKAKHTRDTTLLITNGIETKRISKEETIPDGWHKKKRIGCKTTLNKIAITNGLETKMIEKTANIPDGWRIGTAQRGKVHYTNGTKTIRISKEETPPEGYWRGQHWMTPKPKNDEASH